MRTEQVKLLAGKGMVDRETLNFGMLLIINIVQNLQQNKMFKNAVCFMKALYMAFFPVVPSV